MVDAYGERAYTKVNEYKNLLTNLLHFWWV